MLSAKIRALGLKARLLGLEASVLTVHLILTKTVLLHNTLPTDSNANLLSVTLVHRPGLGQCSGYINTGGIYKFRDFQPISGDMWTQNQQGVLEDDSFADREPMKLLQDRSDVVTR